MKTPFNFRKIFRGNDFNYREKITRKLVSNYSESFRILVKSIREILSCSRSVVQVS